MASPRLEASAQRCPSKAWPNRWHQCHRGRRASTRCPHDDGRREQGRPRAVTNPLQGGEFLALLFSGWIVFLLYFRESIQCQRREGAACRDRRDTCNAKNPGHGLPTTAAARRCTGLGGNPGGRISRLLLVGRWVASARGRVLRGWISRLPRLRAVLHLRIARLWLGPVLPLRISRLWLRAVGSLWLGRLRRCSGLPLGRGGLRWGGR